MKPTPYIDPADGWTRVPIEGIEDLSDAVYGAGLDATQMAKGRLSGSLAFAGRDGITFSSGCILGTVTLTGPLSITQVTLGVGLHFAPGSWHWMNEVTAGEVGLFHAGDEHDCHYTPGALYATLTLDTDRLEREAAPGDDTGMEMYGMETGAAECLAIEDQFLPALSRSSRLSGA